MASTHFAGQEFLELLDGFGDCERVEERLSTAHRAHGHVAHSHHTSAWSNRAKCRVDNGNGPDTAKIRTVLYYHKRDEKRVPSQ